MMIGGANSNESNPVTRIATYTPSTDQWTTEGYLLTPRSSPGVITVDNHSFLIIGGFMKSNTQKISEKCEYNGNQLECAYQDPNQPERKYSQHKFTF